MDVEPEMAVEQGRRDDGAVRAGDDHVRGELDAFIEPFRLSHRDAEPLRGRLRGRRLDLSSSADGTVRPRQAERDLVPRGEPLEDAGAERCRRREPDRRHVRAERLWYPWARIAAAAWPLLRAVPRPSSGRG